MFYSLGRPFGTLRYAVDGSGLAGNSFQTDNYCDANGRLVATQRADSVGTEYAYDGAGRRYQTRTVKMLAGTKWSGYAFQYRQPAPKSSLAEMTGGPDQVLALAHQQYDPASNVIAEHQLKADDHATNGLGLPSTGYVRATFYHWYDGADRRTATGNHGCGDTATSGPGTWKYFGIPFRAATAPPASSDAALITTYAYTHKAYSTTTDSGRWDQVTDPKGLKTRTYYDPLGRRTHLAENDANFNPYASPAGTGDPGDRSNDRVTRWLYAGLDQVTQLIAMDREGTGSSTHETTQYAYGDAVDATRPTRIIYPDSTSANDSVDLVYQVDGTLAQRKDQRGTEIAYVCN